MSVMEMRFEMSRAEQPALVFDPEDRFARERGTRGAHPRPVGPIKYFVIARHGRQIDPPLELVVVCNASGYVLCFGRVKTKDGSVRNGELIPDRYRVLVESDFYQRFEQDTDLPRAGDPLSFDLEPGYAYPFPDPLPLLLDDQTAAACNGQTLPHGRGPTLLRGTLYSHDGKGIMGATVEVVGESNRYRTDKTGQWVLQFPDDRRSGPATVHFVLPGSGGVDVSNVCVVRGREVSLGATGLRGWILAANGVGVAGATIEVDGMEGATLTASDGGWSYYFDLNQQGGSVDVIATLPDGRSLIQAGLPLRPRRTVLVPSFRFLD
jgi:hypothetical protein